MYIYFNNTERDFDEFFLFDKKGVIAKSKIKRKNQDDLLKNLDVFFIKNNLKIKKIKGLATASGTGSFTSGRVASVVANSFFYATKIPVLMLKSGDKIDFQKIISAFNKRENKFLSPRYSGQPNITKSSSWKKV